AEAEHGGAGGDGALVAGARAVAGMSLAARLAAVRDDRRAGGGLDADVAGDAVGVAVRTISPVADGADGTAVGELGDRHGGPRLAAEPRGAARRAGGGDRVARDGAQLGGGAGEREQAVTAVGRLGGGAGGDRALRAVAVAGAELAAVADGAAARAHALVAGDAVVGAARAAQPAGRDVAVRDAVVAGAVVGALLAGAAAALRQQHALAREIVRRRAGQIRAGEVAAGEFDGRRRIVGCARVLPAAGEIVSARARVAPLHQPRLGAAGDEHEHGEPLHGRSPSSPQ